MINVKFKKLDSYAKEPVKGTEGAAAFDLHAASCRITDRYVEYGTGLAAEIPPGFVGILAARSSVSNVGMWLCNSIGVLDSDYRGEIKARFYRSQQDYYEIGDRICQLMIVPVPEVSLEFVDELSTTERGSGGFGSSGTK